MMECPNCKEISLPSPDGGECVECGIPSYFTRESDIAEWNWMYNHDWHVPDGWLVQSTVGFIRRTFSITA